MRATAVSSASLNQNEWGVRNLSLSVIVPCSFFVLIFILHFLISLSIKLYLHGANAQHRSSHDTLSRYRKYSLFFFFFTCRDTTFPSWAGTWQQWRENKNTAFEQAESHFSWLMSVCPGRAIPPLLLFLRFLPSLFSPLLNGFFLINIAKVFSWLEAHRRQCDCDFGLHK